MTWPQSSSLHHDPCPCEACRIRRRVQSEGYSNDSRYFVATQPNYENRSIRGIGGGSSSGAITFMREAARVLVNFSFLTLFLAAVLICYALQLAGKIYNSKNLWPVFAIILIGITALYAFRTTSTVKNSKCVHKQETSRFNRPCPSRSGKCSKILDNCERRSGGSSATAPGNRKVWFKWQSESEPMPVSTNQDEKVKEIVNKLKVYSIPMEMKRPPQFLVYARDYFMQ